MEMTQRRAVSPIIATLLLIAIAVAAGIVVYVYVNGLSGSLTGGGGGAQVSDVLELNSYSFQLNATDSSVQLTLNLQNTGGGSVSIANIYFDGVSVSGSAAPTDGIKYTATPSIVPVGSTTSITFTSSSAGWTSAGSPPVPATGTTHIIKVITTDGGQGVYTVTAGKRG
jgi:archaeal type IV pilus assembly protein PilA